MKNLASLKWHFSIALDRKKLNYCLYFLFGQRQRKSKKDTTKCTSIIWFFAVNIKKDDAPILMRKLWTRKGPQLGVRLSYYSFVTVVKNVFTRANYKRQKYKMRKTSKWKYFYRLSLNISSTTSFISSIFGHTFFYCSTAWIE